MHLLGVLSLFIAASTACGSTCICQKPNGDYLCVSEVTGWHQHDCAGWCHDRVCAGMAAGSTDPFSCRVWRGICEPNGVWYTDARGWKGLHLDFCGKINVQGKSVFNSCKKDFDCP